MSDTLITSDEHYGHNNIIEFCNRPFTSMDEMIETMIERHNKKVPNKQSYLTIHMGDMFWRTLPYLTAKRILESLHGRHAYIRGNHEELLQEIHPELNQKFDWVRDTHQIKWNKRSIWLSHYAHRVWPGSHKGSWHIFGHSHGELPEKSARFGDLGLSFDIGADCHNFEPWTLEEIAVKMEGRKCHHTIDTLWPGKEAHGLQLSQPVSSTPPCSV